MAACHSILPRQYLPQSRGQIHIPVLSTGGRTFLPSVPPCGDGAGPYRHAAQILGRIVGRVFD